MVTLLQAELRVWKCSQQLGSSSATSFAAKPTLTFCIKAQLTIRPKIVDTHGQNTTLKPLMLCYLSFTTSVVQPRLPSTTPAASPELSVAAIMSSLVGFSFSTSRSTSTPRVSAGSRLSDVTHTTQSVRHGPKNGRRNRGPRPTRASRPVHA